MSPIEPYKPEIISLCEKYGIERLDVFGSVLTDEYNAESDIDFSVIFRRSSYEGAFTQYFDFKEALEKLLNRKVDLICYNAIRNPHFKHQVEVTKQAVYVA